MDNKKLREQARKEQKFSLPLTRKREILSRQGNCCFWCHRAFGSQVQEPNKNKAHTLTSEFDHLIPFSSAPTNSLGFVASCQLCNKLKGSTLGTIRDLYNLIGQAWAERYR